MRVFDPLNLDAEAKFRVWGLEFRGLGLGVRGWGLGFRPKP